MVFRQNPSASIICEFFSRFVAATAAIVTFTNDRPSLYRCVATELVNLSCTFGSNTCFLFPSFRILLLISFADATHSHTHAPHHIEAVWVPKTWWKPLRNHVQRYPFAVHQPLNYLHFVWKITKTRIHRNVAQQPMTTRMERSFFFFLFAIHCRTRIEYRWCLLQHLLLLFRDFFSFLPSFRCAMWPVCECVSLFNRLFFVSKWNPNQSEEKKTTRSQWPRKEIRCVCTIFVAAEKKENQQCDERDASE